MTARAGIAAALVLAAAGQAAAGDALPDDDFLEFLGGLDAESGWQGFFDSVPEAPPERRANADSEDEDESE